MMKRQGRWRLAAAAAVILAALLWVGCNDDNEIEPGEGAGLSVNLSPIVVCVGGTSEVEVTLVDEAGDPIVGEPIALAVTPPTGSLTDCVAVACTTDADGKVTSTFTSSTAGPYTVTATGGTVTSPATLTVVAPGTGSLTLAETTPGDTIFTSCSTAIDTIPVSGARLDGSSAPISGALISLEVVTSFGGLSATLLAVPVATAADGTYSATLVPEISSTDCTACATTACSVTVKVVSDCISSPDPGLTLTESF